MNNWIANEATALRKKAIALNIVEAVIERPFQPDKSRPFLNGNVNLGNGRASGTDLRNSTSPPPTQEGSSTTMLKKKNVYYIWS